MHVGERRHRVDALGRQALFSHACHGRIGLESGLLTGAVIAAVFFCAGLAWVSMGSLDGVKAGHRQCSGCYTVRKVALDCVLLEGMMLCGSFDMKALFIE